ncbi:methylase involved in ubiquinone/menaquinone biosynthesis [Allocoleopsis franciscana PCC 7113]|uniref:Methylase involved in ubiquinone/menaquinone biosynthesis n=2 Tax=Allocoleopsis TaxID=2886347 RepID=K9WGX0_9CYAN|nr:methylase involved in ubiquinone/menaquinone biosynthesis [Allocoleopsis franciscana PCC 7113]
MCVNGKAMTKSPFDFDTNPNFQVTDYDIVVRQSIPGYDALLSMVTALLQLELTDTADILIVGAGGGNEISVLGQAHPTWQFTGVDPSEKMLAVAQSKVESLNLGNRVALHNGFVQELPLHQFSAATSLLVMHFLPDDGTKLDYLQAIASRLQPGSPFLLVDFQGDKQSESFKRLVDGWQQRARTAGMEPQRLTELANGIWQHLHCIPEERTLELLAQAKFKNVVRFYTGFIFTGWLAFAE